MGKKKIIQQTQEELIKEKERVDQISQKEVRVESRRVGEGKIYIASSYNNTILTLTDLKGNVLTWVSAGRVGFKGSKKSTPFAASRVAEVLSDTARKLGVERVEVLVRGVGGGRDSAIRSLLARGLDVIGIKDVTPIPHNGCRPPKARRM